VKVAANFQAANRMGVVSTEFDSVPWQTAFTVHCLTPAAFTIHCLTPRKEER